MNWFVVDVTNWPAGYDPEHWHWNICLVKRADRIPFFLDCILAGLGVDDCDDPPPYDDVFRGGDICVYAINRHNRGINGLFMDWSARKVGLKELWTLKWHREFDTANGWTRAGGVRPTNWPEWMRKFKDY